MIQNPCGVDVSKDWLDAFAEPRFHQRFANDPRGIADLARFCRDHGITLVAMEASGGVERLPFTLLWAQGVACALVNPRGVRDFARAMGHLEKTDRIDAAAIARFAAARSIRPTPPPSPGQQELAATNARLRQVTGDLIVQKQRLHTARDTCAREGLLEIIAVLKRQSRDLAAKIAQLVAADPLWAALDAAFRQVKGVADRTVAVLLADLGEIGTVSDKQIAKLAGLAPLANDSGKRLGNRHIRGGRAGVRSILFLVADIARKYDPSLAGFRQRLLNAGKPKMVVRIALARKLLVRLNAKARDARAVVAS